ncbi:MAG: FAD-binding protein [Alphaproteobacteria bacterium]|nr:FAD-binding protein [Alphaproteobacteria bacterium]
MALDRLDAVVIGAGVEGLVAAAALAVAGRSVAVVERQAENAPIGEGGDAVVSLALAHDLDLTAHGLRFAAAPPIVGVTSDRAFVLWPELRAAQASVAAFSPRDAEALEGFYARIARSSAGNGATSSVAWLTSNAGAPSDGTAFALSSVARILDEAFDSDLLKGLLAQGAIMGTGASPLAPGSAALLSRQALLAQAAPDNGYRFVAGGARKLRQALLALLKFYNNADVLFRTEAKALATERDAVQSVVLADGTSLQSPLVVSTLSAEASRAMLTGLRRAAPPAISAGGVVKPAQVKLTISALPKLAGVDAATLASGAILRLMPSIGRLAKAHGAFRSHALGADPCLDLRLAARDGKRWELLATMPYVPATTAEGPWTGNRRDKIRTLCVRAIDSLAPGFGASIEGAEVLHPPESGTVMDTHGAAALMAQAALDVSAIPEMRAAAATTLVKGLAVLEPSIFSGQGDAGLAAADAAAPRAKVRADA